MTNNRIFAIGALAAIMALGTLTGCGNGTEGGVATDGSNKASDSGNGGKLSGKVVIDGSSTVMPISQRVSEAFKEAEPNVDVPVAESGTGSGMKKFIAGEIDICDASRPIKAEEVDQLKAKGIEFIEIPIAFDGLSVIVHKDNNLLTSITVDELKKIWTPAAEKQVTNWSQIRAGLPNKPLTLYGPATNHGTYEYFAEVAGEKKATRQDYQQNQEYNALVQGVANDPNALGYVGFSYVEENSDKVKAIPVDAGKGAIMPTAATIADGTYAPLSRPLFIYVSKKAMERPEVKRFVEFYIEKAKELVPDAKYIPLPDKAYELAKERAAKAIAGTVFQGIQPGMKIEDVLAKESAPK